MALISRLKNAEEEYTSFVALLNKQRVAFKYFAMHQAFLPGDLLRVHIFPKVFDADYMFCKFLEEFDEEHYRFTDFYYLRSRLTRCIYKKVSSSLMVKFELFGSLNTLPMPYDSEEEKYNNVRLHKHFQTFIYQYMKSKDYKLRVTYPNGYILNYSEVRARFMNQHNTLKEKRDRLALLETKQTQSLKCLKNYTSNFIIYQTLCQKRYNYVRFVKNCPKSIRVQPSMGDYARDNPNMLELNAFERHYTTLIKKEEIVKVIDPKDIPQDQIKDGMVSIKFLDSM